MRAALLAAACAAALLLLASGTSISPLSAQETGPAKTLTPGKGSELTLARCGTCHEIMHITRAKLSRGEWQDNVRNMIERGAPIAASEVPIIVDYLAAYYNRDSPAPPADPSAAAQDPVQHLLAANACIACHGVDQKIIGPSFKEIAARYATDDDAGAKLAAKIRTGGSGTWGPVPMPPHPDLRDAELRQLVGWILGQK